MRETAAFLNTLSLKPELIAGGLALGERRRSAMS
jgi:hypothetical protein